MPVPASGLWHFQFVHHDLWDMDNPTPATRDGPARGRMGDIAAQGTKMGLLYVFDRVTGRAALADRGTPCPRIGMSDMAGMPDAALPYMAGAAHAAGIHAGRRVEYLAEAQQLTTDLITQSGAYGSFPPPSLEQKIKFPDTTGAWNGADRLPTLTAFVRECQRDAVVLPAHPNEA